MSGPPRHFGHVPYAEELELIRNSRQPVFYYPEELDPEWRSSEASWKSCLGWAFGVPIAGAALTYLAVAIMNGVN